MPIISGAIFIVGLILGIIGMKKTAKKGISIAGVVLSSIGLLGSILVGLILLMTLMPYL